MKLAFSKDNIIKSMEITGIIFLFCPEFRLRRYAIPVRNMNVHPYFLPDLTWVSTDLTTENSKRIVLISYYLHLFGI